MFDTICVSNTEAAHINATGVDTEGGDEPDNILPKQTLRLAVERGAVGGTVRFGPVQGSEGDSGFRNPR